MELRQMAFLKGVHVLTAGIFSALLISCGTYNKGVQGNPTYRNCAGYETIGYTTKSDATGIYKLHGKVRYCKTGKAAGGAHISVKDKKDSIIAEAQTDKHGKYSITYRSPRRAGRIDVTSINGSLAIITHDIGQFHLNTELNVRLYYVESFINEVPLTKDDIEFLKKKNKK